MLGNSANIVLQIITDFCSEYRTVLDGNNQEISSIELSGGARISFVFHELYSNGIKAVDPFDQVKDIDIRTLLYNSSGPTPALFVGTGAFELIVKQQIRRLEDPSLKCVSLVYDELVRILTNILQKPILRRYPSLKEKFHAVVISFFKKAIDPTNNLVKDLVSMEACYINTGHPDFLNGHKVREICGPERNSKPSSSKMTKSSPPTSRIRSSHWASQLFCDIYESNKLPQAMAIVNDRHNAAKPTQVDPKTGRPLPPAVPPRAASPSLDLPQNDQGGFFGSFFAPKNKKKMAAMDSPPPQLKASGTLSEKEANEVEVISKYGVFHVLPYADQSPRTSHQLLLQHYTADYDRYGAQSYHVETCTVSFFSLSLRLAYPLTMIQTHQGRNPAGASREHVPHQRARRPLEGKRLHDQETERVSPNGGELEQG